jgi:iron-sulfur cluster assembly accessory protein
MLLIIKHLPTDNIIYSITIVSLMFSIIKFTNPIKYLIPQLSIIGKHYHVKTKVMTITPKAAQKLKDYVVLSNNNINDTIVRLNVKKKGCSGHIYSLELFDKTNSILKDDEIIKQNDVTLAINSKSIMNIIGTNMDYVEDELVSEFMFNNPNVVNKCSCSVKFN